MLRARLGTSVGEAMPVVVEPVELPGAAAMGKPGVKSVPREAEGEREDR